ncbi:MAG TPA: LapA family protein, partial [bacterium]|nr:LapA family protein [bacterium]
MWRTLKLIFTLGILFGGTLVGVYFVNANPAMVNVQFPFVARESGDLPLGIALLGATGVGVGVALLLALISSVGMTLHVARLKREIKALRREVDALRNLPILEEEIERETDDEDEEDILEDSRSIDIASGPVRSGSTVAPVGGDDDDDEDDEPEESVDDELADTRLSGSTRKVDLP